MTCSFVLTPKKPYEPARWQLRSSLIARGSTCTIAMPSCAVTSRSVRCPAGQSTTSGALSAIAEATVGCPTGKAPPGPHADTAKTPTTSEASGASFTGRSSRRASSGVNGRGGRQLAAAVAPSGPAASRSAARAWAPFTSLASPAAASPNGGMLT